jgi:aldehyde:ferredoxin oxidoreductase
MGSKKLKAIVVSGSGRVPVRDRDRLREFAKGWAQQAQERGLGTQVHAEGTAGWQDNIYAQGWLPVRNLTTNEFPEYANFRGKTIRGEESFRLTREPCHACPLRHCHRLEIVSGPNAGFDGAEPEYEDLAQWSSNVGNTDLVAAILLTDLNDRLGMNVNGAGFAISLAMECYEKGLITKQDADGLELTWGNTQAVRELLVKMAKREGFGAVLCDGPMKAAERIGGDAPKLAVHMGKGNAPHAHDPRGVWGVLVDQAVTDTASLQGGVLMPLWDPEAVAKAERDSVIRSQFLDSLVICHFTAGGLKTVAEGLECVTGLGLDIAACLLGGERTINLFRLFNIREGLTPSCDTASPRLLEAPVDGPNKGRVLGPLIDQAVRAYYREMGWDEDTGRPLPATLEGLGIEVK